MMNEVVTAAITAPYGRFESTTGHLASQIHKWKNRNFQWKLLVTSAPLGPCHICRKLLHGWYPASGRGFTRSHVTDSQSRDDVHSIYAVDRSRNRRLRCFLCGMSHHHFPFALIIFLPHITHLVFIIDCLFQPPTTLV